MTKEILRDFKKHSKSIWKSPLIDKIDFGVKVRKQKNMMSLAYNSRPKVVADTLFQVPRKMNLYVSERATKLPKKQFQQLLRHEAIHIGHANHDKDFRRVAKKYGIPLTLTQSEGGGYKVEIKKGSRYSAVRTFSSHDKARKYAKELVKSKKGSRVRVSY